MRCRYCGKDNADYARFCAGCGRPLKVADAEEGAHQEKRPNVLIIFLVVIIIALAAVAFVIFFLFGSSATEEEAAETYEEIIEDDNIEDYSEDKADTEEDNSADEGDGEELYSDVLDMFYYNILSGWEDYEATNNYGGDVGEDISSLFYQKYADSDIDSVGYMFVDLDGNGIPELLIGIDDGDEGSTDNDFMIYDLYTYLQGEIVHLASSGDGYGYLLCEDNTMYYYRATGGGSVSFANYILTEDADELSILECVWRELDDDGVTIHSYYSSSEFYGSDAEELSYKEATMIIISWSGKVVELELTPFSSYTPSSENEADSEEDDSADEVDGEELYADVLDIFYYNILSEWVDYEPTNNFGGNIGEDISYLFYWHYIMSNDIDSVGYAFVDLDDNGIPELLISIDDGEYYDGSMIYDMYTYVQGEIVHIASGDEMYGFQLCEDNTIDYGEGGAWYGYYANYILTEDELSILECVWYDLDDDGETFYWYHSTTGYHGSDTEEISEDEAYEIIESWPQIVELELTPFSSYTPKSE